MSEGADSDDSERSHQPTQKRLDDARVKGQGPMSADLTTAAAYGGFALAALAFGTGSLLALGSALTVPLGQADRLAGQMFGGSGAMGVITGLTATFLSPALPWLVLPGACALVAVVAQGAPFAPDKLAPKGSRLSPFATLKQKFGLSGLVEFGKSFAKLCLFATILALFLQAALPRLIGLAALPVGPAVTQMLRDTTSVILIVTAIMAALGLADLVWQRLNFLRRNMMSRKEVTDEQKESEGDPHIKGQRRQRGQTIAMNQMLADVPRASVVIVNPSHYAVALHWDAGGARAPVCLAKGTDEVAAKIRELAMAHRIPIHRDPPTARALHASVAIGAEIPRAHYRAVAAAIRFAETLRQRR